MVNYENNTFEVTDEEVIKMVKELSQDFEIKEVEKLSKTWIKALMSQPYSKNKLQRRPFAYSKEKLAKYLKWRTTSKITSKIAYNLSNDIDGSSQKDFKPLTTCSPGNLYWHGTDNEGSPILWNLANLTRFQKADIKNEMEHTSLVIQAALDSMPENIHNFNFILCFDVYDPFQAMMKPTIGPTFIKMFMKTCPDRLKRAYIVTGSIGHIFYNLAKQLAPVSLMNKVTQTKSREITAQLLVDDGVLRKDEIPDFMGGTSVHDQNITLDYPSMIKAIKLSMDTTVPPSTSKVLSSDTLNTLVEDSNEDNLTLL